MTWLQATDTGLFRVLNQSLANPLFDWLMPLLSGNRLFLPLAALAAAGWLWKGGRRGRVFVLALVLALAVADGFVCNTIKKAVQRPRPCVTLPETRLLVGCSKSGSLPSAHAANWFAAVAVTFVFYRRRWWLVGLAASAVGFSRIYNGVHYPADVLAGAALGAGAGFATVWLIHALWQWLGRRWFPRWWAKLPSLANPAVSGNADAGSSPADVNAHWLRLGYLLIATLLLIRLVYIASGTISLSKDEAYQWLWSKHLALSYFSKPPGIAFIQRAGTSLWGDTELGVRFFSPVFAAIISLAVLRFMAREVGARPGFLLLLVVSATPLLGVGSVLLTVDPPLALCWMFALIAGWRAVQTDGTTRHWFLAGLATGLGFLCKYSAAYQVLCWAVFFVLWRPARAQLRRPGPYVALLVFAACTLPVVLWNAQHGWITASHVAGNASLDKPWRFTLRFFWDFLGMELGLLNPVFFVAALWALAAAWRRRQDRPLWLFLFCMSAPVFLGHAVYSLRARILPNWIAPAVLPMFCLMVAYWDTRWREGCRGAARWLGAGLALGLAAMALMHESDLISKFTGRALPGEVDPLRRVRAWKETAAVVEAARNRLATESGPAFVIADHYGMTSLLTFYPPGRAAGEVPRVYPRGSALPNNQFYFWPEYRYRESRRGQNAIYVQEIDPYKLESGWLWKWLMGRDVNHARIPPLEAAPAVVAESFGTVVSLGEFEVKRGRRVFRRLQLFECRNLQ